MRLFAWSDLHVDYQQNFAHLVQVSASDHQNDTLLLAGDLTDKLALLEKSLGLLNDKFQNVVFVPGNHELWISNQACANSLQKLAQVLQLCIELEIHITPLSIDDLLIVPLLSWYMQPEQGEHSLYLPKATEKKRKLQWADDHWIKWPADMQMNPAHYFYSQNKLPKVAAGKTVITMSHFLPRQELMFPQYPLPAAATIKPSHDDPHPWFNFSRVAGCSLIDQQIRQLGSKLHVYGHQHRNRQREIEGINYISHCLGYPREKGLNTQREPPTKPVEVFVAH